MKPLFLERNKTGLIVVDVQEKLFPHIERPCEILEAMSKVIKGFQILGMPVIATEQYPEGLNHTIPALKNILGDQQRYFKKTVFSAAADPAIKTELLGMKIDSWVLIGIEAHICVLQTAKDLIAEKKNVVVCNDAISSRSIYDFSTAIAEMRDSGVRVTSVETVLFELIRDSKVPEFKQISALVK